MIWQCELPRTECPCVCCQLWRCKSQRDDARELAAMYLQCLVSRSLERGDSVDKNVKFLKAEFAENPWLKEEYQKIVDTEEDMKQFIEMAGLR